MTLPVLTAVNDATWEADILGALERDDRGVTVVRRCVDVTDLLAAATAGMARAVVVSPALRRLDREVVSRLDAAGVAVVAVLAPGDDENERRLRQFGIRHVVTADADATVLVDILVAAIAEPQAPAGFGWSDLRPGVVEPVGIAAGHPASALAGPGRVIAVWGPTGGPGRTTVAVGLADEISRLGVSTVLIDADTYGGVVAQMLGILDEAPGLAAACRLASSGGLDLASLAREARAIGPHLRVLTGLSRADRWPELRPDALRAVLDRSRALAAVTVVDCGFCLEADEEAMFDGAVPRRNGSTLAVLEEADIVLAVGAADPIGVHRLIRGLADLREVLPMVSPRVVANRVRASAVRGDAVREVSAAVERFAGLDVFAYLPDDRESVDRAAAEGRTLAETGAGSALRIGLRQLAAEVAGVPAPEHGRRRR